MAALEIQYYSDVLCVWAYVGQVRVEECRTHFGDKISVEQRYVDVFGDIPGRIRPRWERKGGLASYSEHVREVVDSFDHIDVHPEVWTRNVPTSSLPCHEFLHAVHLAEGLEAQERCSWAIREAFFQRIVDVSAKQNLYAIAEELSLDVSEIERNLTEGKAMARLSRDLRDSREQHILVSPTMVCDGGRQLLKGNVGYKIMEANIQELLLKGSAEHSWC